MSKQNIQYIDQDKLTIDEQDAEVTEQKIKDKVLDKGQVLEFKHVILALNNFTNSLYTVDMLAEFLGVNRGTVRDTLPYTNQVVEVGQLKTGGTPNPVYTTVEIDKDNNHLDNMIHNIYIDNQGDQDA